MRTFTDDLVNDFTAHLPVGRGAAIQGRDLAGELSCSERMIRTLADEAIDRGWLVGSTCNAERPGYFLIVDEEDLQLGTAHLVARARSMLDRVRRVRLVAEGHFGPEALRLFDLEEVDA